MKKNTFIRVMCFILAGVMVLGVALTAIVLLLH